MDAAFERVLALIDGQPTMAPQPQAEIAQRIAALEEAGWTLVHRQEARVEPVEGADGLLEQQPGLWRFERLWRSHAHSIAAETLEAAVTATENEQARISQLDNTTLKVHTGQVAR
jgi:hypothetical protein